MKYFYGTTESGERVEINLSSLMNAKWDSSGELIRVNSSLGSVEVEADSIENQDAGDLRAELKEACEDRRKLRAALDNSALEFAAAMINSIKCITTALENNNTLRAENERLKETLRELVDSAQILPLTFPAEYHERFYFAMKQAREKLAETEVTK